MSGIQIFDQSRFMTPTAEDFQPNGNACLATFYYESEKDEVKTKIENRPIFHDKVFIEILKPGGIDKVVSEATDEDKRRYPKAWAAFERQGSHAIQGTPIDELTFLTRSRKNEFKAMNIMTVEQLAALDGASIDRCGMGTRKEVEKAQHFLKMAADGAHAQKLVDALSELNARLESIESENQELKNTLDKIQKENQERETQNGKEKGQKGRA